MTEAQFLEQLEAWALGGLTSEEREAIEGFLSAHATPALLEARARAFETASLLAASLAPSRPPPEAWERLRAALPMKSNGAQVGGAATVRRGGQARAWQIVGWAVAAAALLAVVWLVRDRRDQVERASVLASQLEGAQQALAERERSATTLAQAGEGCRRALETLRARDALAAEAVALLELAGTQLIPLERRGAAAPALGEAAANAIYHRGVKRAYVVVAGFPSTGEAYTVWVLRGAQRVAAGTLRPDERGRAVASVPRPSLDPGVPEKLEVTRADGTVLFESRVRI